MNIPNGKINQDNAECNAEKKFFIHGNAGLGLPFQSSINPGKLRSMKARQAAEELNFDQMLGNFIMETLGRQLVSEKSHANGDGRLVFAAVG